MFHNISIFKSPGEDITHVLKFKKLYCNLHLENLEEKKQELH